MERWESGTQIMWRSGETGDDFVEPMTVVRDGDRGLAAWLAMGTPVVVKTWSDGRDRRAEARAALASGQDVRAVAEALGGVPRVRVASTWTGTHLLRVAPPDVPWSVWHFFDGATYEFLGWYVNIEEPHVREPFAIRATDLTLDLWVTPDRVPHRKDEDELALAVATGRYTPEQAERIVAVCDEVEGIAAAWGSPFCDGWETFRPDASWPVPELPERELDRCSTAYG